MRTLIKAVKSLVALSVVLALAGFVSLAGGHSWGTDMMGANMAIAAFLWAVIQPVIWLD